MLHRASQFWLAVFFLVTFANGVLAKTVVYVSLAAEERIDIYDLDELTGELTLAHKVPIAAGEPGALTTDPQGKLLLAAIRSTGKLASFRIRHDDGSLQSVSVVEAGADPAQISTDQTGAYLLTAYYVAAKVSVHRLQADGSIQMPPIQETATAANAHAIVADPTNRFVYVPHTGPNAIFQFAFVPGRGTLAPLTPDRKIMPANSGPRHLVFHPTRSIAYIDNEQGSSVTVWAPDRTTGDLTAGQTISTLPDDYQADNACAELRIHPSGKFLYVANRGHNSIAVFTVDASGQRLVSLGATATEAVPRSFDIDPSGRFLIAAGEASGRLATYRIDAERGTLAPLTAFDVGRMPWWVMAVRLPEAKVKP